jgi:hypothetical protein
MQVAGLVRLLAETIIALGSENEVPRADLGTDA